MVVTCAQHALALGILDTLAEQALEGDGRVATALVIPPTLTRQITNLMEEIWKASKKP